MLDIKSCKYCLKRLKPNKMLVKRYLRKGNIFAFFKISIPLLFLFFLLRQAKYLLCKVFCNILLTSSWICKKCPSSYWMRYLWMILRAPIFFHHTFTSNSEFLGSIFFAYGKFWENRHLFGKNRIFKKKFQSSNCSKKFAF